MLASLLCGLLVLSLCILPSCQTHGAPRAVDETRARAAGIRKLNSRHLTLYTDLPSNAEVDSLPQVFDQAVPQWAEYLEVPESQTRRWRMQGFLIKNREVFDALNLMPKGNDGFRNGLSLENELWLYEQPTPYYRRHLLLHEGTHGFMATQLGSCGPGWYMEGTAELLATHKLETDTSRLTLRYMPLNRQEVPMLGRIKLVNDAFNDQRTLPLVSVLAIDNQRHLENEAYAWCWALSRFLDDHPRYQARFRSLVERTAELDFTDQMRRLYSEDWNDLCLEWNLFAASLVHGHDVANSAIEFQAGKPMRGATATAIVAADRGWQSTGIALSEGREYKLTAKGRYQVARSEEGIWWCEPGGVTIEYHGGLPLGVLLAAVDPGGDDIAQRTTSFLVPQVVGLAAKLKPTISGTLYLKVNDSPGSLAENSGQLRVVVEK